MKPGYVVLGPLETACGKNMGEFGDVDQNNPSRCSRSPQMTQAITIDLAAHHNQKVRPTAEDTTYFCLEHREI